MLFEKFRIVYVIFNYSLFDGCDPTVKRLQYLWRFRVRQHITHEAVFSDVDSLALHHFQLSLEHLPVLAD